MNGTISVRSLLIRSLGTCLAMLVLVGAVGMAGVSLASGGLNAYAGFEPQRLAHRAALQALTDAETGVRGYRLTHDEVFLDPYRDGRGRFGREMSAAMHSDDSDEITRLLHDELATGNRWLEGYADPLAQTSPSRLDARGQKYAHSGRAMFDDYRVAHATTAQRIDELQEERLRRGHRAESIAFLVTLAAIAVAVVAVVATVLRTHRLLLIPLRRVRRAIAAFRPGESDRRLDEQEGPLELREIARGLNLAAERVRAAETAREDLLRMRELAREIGRRVGMSLDTDRVVLEAVTAVGTAIGADRVYVRLMNDGHLDAAVTEWHAEGLAPSGREWQGVAEDATARVRALFVEGQIWHSALVRKPRDVSDLLTRNHVERTGARSTVLVPIGSGDELLGVLVILQTERIRFWEAPLLELAESVAADLGRALVNARSFGHQEELVERLQELDRVKSDFLATVSHELRTPLTSIAGYVELIRDEDAGPVTPQMDSMLDVVDRNAARLKALIEDLLTLSRIEADSFKLATAPMDVEVVVSGALRTIAPDAASAGVEVEVLPGPDTLHLVGDAGQLERAVLNVLSNAVKFTPAGGRVTVSTAETGGLATIMVRDTGIGIPQAEQPRLFSRFFRASNATAAAIQGTGLGLTIVRGIAEHHGGTLEIDSVEGVGTTVTLTLPLPEPAERGMAQLAAAL
jgi:two-component system phosphate regulon sensor histidine kinase PhoR